MPPTRFNVTKALGFYLVSISLQESEERLKQEAMNSFILRTSARINLHSFNWNISIFLLLKILSFTLDSQIFGPALQSVATKLKFLRKICKSLMMYIATTTAWRLRSNCDNHCLVNPGMSKVQPAGRIWPTIKFWPARGLIYNYELNTAGWILW